MTTRLKKIEKAATKKPHVSSTDDPVDELRRLVKQHRSLTKSSVAIKNMVGDKTARQDIPARGLKAGEKIKSDIPEDAQAEANLLAEGFKARAGKLESAMTRELKRIPIYTQYLSRVFGFGPVVCAYLITDIDIHKAVKPSNLRRFCGMAVINGRLERPTKGVKLAYNAELRTRLYQAFSAMWKNAAKNGTWVYEDKLPDEADPDTYEQRVNPKTKRQQYKLVREDAPHGVTSKYLTIWTDYKHRMAHSDRVDAKKNTLRAHQAVPCDDSGVDERKGARAIIHATGWHKAADVFLTDLYLVWRALEGLPVWCPYVADKLTGYWHASDTPAWQGGRNLDLAEALALVGEVGAVAVAEIAQAAE